MNFCDSGLHPPAKRDGSGSEVVRMQCWTVTELSPDVRDRKRVTRCGSALNKEQVLEHFVCQERFDSMLFS